MLGADLELLLTSDVPVMVNSHLPLNLLTAKVEKWLLTNEYAYFIIIIVNVIEIYANDTTM